ncbi:MAG TPA: HAMP domain-containing protein [Campylobacteraceae bacterium]|nr:HAMP domain-containing protein [Campylobacteraceae bacterium]HHD83278.1 HAMP domain-containing protein [Campylobacteraceae bacterium]
MKKSIFYNITFIFVVAAMAVGVAYLYMLKYDKQKYTQELNERYSIVARATLYRLLKEPVTDELARELAVYKMRLIKDTNLIKEVLQKGEVLQKLKAKVGSSAIYYYNKSNFLLIESVNNRAILLYDRAFKPYRTQILYIKLIFGAILIVLFLAYLWTISRLSPIKKLKTEIDKFAKGDLNIDCKMERGDEISEVANAFNHAVDEIKKLNRSRKLFLRNIMHELKTPITKGMLSAEMLPPGKQKERLVSVFQRLESLLNEFIAIEQITVDGSFLNKRVYRVIDVIDEAIDISMADRNSIELTIQEDLQIKVDFKLFSIAIKNMIDNGIKYSSDSKVHLFAEDEGIEFLSKGEKLEHPLDYYIEPFTQGESNRAGKSFGLGLYIVDSILKAHKMELAYEYRNGYNIFKFNKIMPIL